MNVAKPYTFDRVVRIVIGLVVLVVLFLLVRRLSSVLLPFLIAWLMAYLLQPFVGFFQYKLKFKNRILSIFSTLLLFVIVIVGLSFLLIPMISAEMHKLAEIIALYMKGINVNSFVPVEWQNEIRAYLSQLDIQAVLKDENIMAAIKKVAPQLWNILNGSINLLLGLTVTVIIFLYLIFILLDYEKITDGMYKIIPQKYRELVVDIVSDLEEGMNRYFRGQALVALIVSVFFIIGFSIIGLPLAIVFGLLMGVLNMVPYLKTVAVIPALFLAFLQSAETGQSFLNIMLWLIIVFLVIQVIEDLFLVPKIMGKVTGLNPAVILLSLSIWGSLMGVVGLIIALPLTTLLISYYKRLVLRESMPEQVVITEPAEVVDDSDI